jgi:DNA-binding transcriptional LysR family regulator
MNGVEARQLTHFLAVVDHGSVTRAAKALYVSQPSLSQALRGLEERLGVRLFRRTGRGVVPTREGAALVAPARRILRTLEDCHRSLRAISRLEAGQLVVAADALLALDPLVGIIERWHRSHPDVVIDIRAPRVGSTVVDMVRLGMCEVGVTDGAPPRQQLVAYPLGEQEMVLVLPPGSAPPGIVGLAELTGDRALPLVLPPEGSAARGVIDAAFDQVGVRPRVVVECPHFEAVGTMVLHGAGGTFFPESLAEFWREQGAVVCRTRPALVREVTAVTRSDTVSPSARSFLAHALGERP